MLEEVHPDKVNYWVFKEYVQLIQNEAVELRDAELLARRRVADRLSVNLDMMKRQDVMRGRRLIGAEQVRLMRTARLRPRQAWKRAIETVATQIGVDAIEFASVWKRYKWRQSQLSNFHWEGIMMVAGNLKRLAQYHYWHRYRDLFEGLLKILYEYDVLGAGGHASGGVEYCLEVDRILPELASIRSEDDIWDILYQVFLDCCGEGTASSGFSFDGIAAAMWEFLGRSDSPLDEW